MLARPLSFVICFLGFILAMLWNGKIHIHGGARQWLNYFRNQIKTELKSSEFCLFINAAESGGISFKR